MPHGRVHRNGRGENTSYDFQIPRGKVKDAGFIEENETVTVEVEYEAEPGKITITKKKI